MIKVARKPLQNRGRPHMTAPGCIVTVCILLEVGYNAAACEFYSDRLVYQGRVDS